MVQHSTCKLPDSPAQQGLKVGCAYSDGGHGGGEKNTLKADDALARCKRRERDGLREATLRRLWELFYRGEAQAPWYFPDMLER